MLHKKLLDASVLYSSYEMFPVDHDLWSTLPPDISLITKDVVIIFWPRLFAKSLISLVSRLSLITLSRSRHLYTSRHKEHDRRATQQQHNNKNNNPTTNQQQHDTTINNMTTNKTTKNNNNATAGQHNNMTTKPTTQTTNQE